MGSPLALVEMALVLGVALGLGFHQLWLLRKSEKEPRRDDAGSGERGPGQGDPR